MSKLNIGKLIKTVQRSASKHAPEILTAVGIAGMVTAGIMAVKATPKALERIEEEKERQTKELYKKSVDEGTLEEVDAVEKLKPADVLKVTWKYYIPAVGTGVASAICLIGSNRLSARRCTALATAYTLSETALKEYQEAALETVGEKKEQVIRDKVAKDRIDKEPVRSNEVIITSKGDTLCYDSISGRYFKSDMESIKSAQNNVNHRMMSEMYISLNEFYYELGLDTIGIGNDLGWNLDEGILDLDFSSQLTEDGTPCLVVSYRVAPKYDYTTLM